MRWFRRNVKYLFKFTLVGFVFAFVIYLLLYNDGMIGDLDVRDVWKRNDIDLPTRNNTSRPSLAPSFGEELAKRVLTKCKGRQLLRTTYKFPVTTNKQHNILYCPICKLGSTYWTRFFKYLERHSSGILQSPYDIPIADAPPTSERIVFNHGNETSQYRGYYRYMFVRDPYARIVSAYVDKLFAPNPSFWGWVSKKIIEKFRGKGSSKFRCGSDLKFAEYVKGIISAHKLPGKSVDCHDATFVSYCHVCETKFDFIGKMESFTADSNFIYRKVDLNETIDFLMEHGKSLGDEDALIETISAPFDWKDDIKKCMPWREALKRLWRKLQIRAVIGKEEFPLDKIQSEKISRSEFIQLVKDTGKLTPASVRKLQRKEALLEMFSEVPRDDLEALSRVYADDFALFEYDPKPDYLFNATFPVKKYGYMFVE